MVINIYKPTYSSSLSIPPHKGILLLCLLNFAQVLAQLALGYVSDKQPLTILIFISTFVSAVTVFTLWYLAPFFSTLVLFSLTYGLFADSYVALYPRFISSLTTYADTSI